MSNQSEGNLVKEVYIKAKNTSESDECYAFMQELLDYTLSFSYVKRKRDNICEKLRTFIDCDFDYKRTVEVLQEQNIITTYKGLKTAVWNVNCNLKEVLGADILKVVDSNLGLAKLRFIVGTTGDILLKEVYKKWPKHDVSYSYDLNECKKEAAFLGLFSCSWFEWAFSQLDKRKLEYLLDLISTPTDARIRDSVKLIMLLKKIDYSQSVTLLEFLNDGQV